jgi:3-oxoadipate enol-lactonase
MFDHGSGSPLVVIPGVQGRWEWIRPALDALARRHRTISYSLRAADDFEQLVAQMDATLDERGIDKAAICGVSYGGLIALAYAAARPERTERLVLVSTPSPSWKPSPSQARYLGRPRLSAPIFFATAPTRVWPEIAAAIDAWSSRMRFCVEHTVRVATAPVDPSQMAARVRLSPGQDLCAACARITAPTLVVTGEPALDTVVPVSSTMEYTRLISGARHEKMSQTGHIGLVTQPDRFAGIVSGFLNGSHS